MINTSQLGYERLTDRHRLVSRPHRTLLRDDETSVPA
jgi:hypothetical protein